MEKLKQKWKVFVDELSLHHIVFALMTPALGYLLLTGVKTHELAMVNSVKIAASNERAEIYQKHNIKARDKQSLAIDKLLCEVAKIASMVDILSDKVSILDKNIALRDERIRKLEIKVAKLEAKEQIK